MPGSPAEALLGRLDAVRQTGADQWHARCPAHDDRRPSLSVRATSDGTLLVRCWAGCSAADIVDAVGLTLADLFPAPAGTDHRRRPTPSRSRWDYRALLRLVDREAMVVMMAARDMAGGHALTPEVRERLADAARRIAQVAEAAR